MNLLPPSLCIKINTNGYNIAFVYTESTKLCKNPVKLSLKYHVNSLGEKRKVRHVLPLPDFPFFSLPKFAAQSTGKTCSSTPAQK